MLHVSRDPVAIIGIGCRFADALTAAEFWQALGERKDWVREVPPERWDVDAYFDSNPTVPGKTACRWGSFLADIDQFDPTFFGISEEEALSLDPQQRVLLETSWEALEDAGIPVDSLAASRTGVFVGLSTADYRDLVQSSLPDNPYGSTGNNTALASNRISYCLDLRGPSFTVNTACSSALVAVDLACRSLWLGESSLALAGGVSVMLHPRNMIRLSQGGLLSKTGRCRAFDADADGYVRGEGVGVIVLKPLAQALADHNRIYAVIRGGSVNQDGRSNGLTAPNPEAQEDLIRTAYTQAHISPGSVTYIEAHGTGTLMGDALELKTLGKVLNQDRASGSVCYVGTLKTNLGHTEAASGIAAVIKTALALHHQYIPAHLHFSSPNPYVNLQKLSLTVPTQGIRWPKDPASDQKARAGVSSFGFGGTNAHLILEEAPLSDKTPLIGSDSRRAHILTLSAKSSTALKQMILNYQAFFESHPDISLASCCYTASVRRNSFPYRLAVVGQDIPTCLHTLVESIHQDPKSFESLVTKVNPRKRKPVIFFCSGQNTGNLELSRFLAHHFPVFQAALAESQGILSQESDFMQDYALARLWQQWGIVIGQSVGHGYGLILAAVLSGVMSLTQALGLLTGSEDLASGELHSPQIPMLNLKTGLKFSEKELTTWNFWQQPERFTGNLLTILPGSLEDPNVSLLEIGTSKSLCPLRVTSLTASTWHEMLQILATLWIQGQPIAWQGVYDPTCHEVISLPYYPFEHRRYWIPDPLIVSTSPVNANPRANSHSTPINLTQERDPERPRTPLEKEIAQVWQTLLKNPSVTIHQTFKDCGGNSQLAAQLIAILENRFQKQFPLETFFQPITIERLATMIQSEYTHPISSEATSLDSPALTSPALTPEEYRTLLVSTGSFAGTRLGSRHLLMNVAKGHPEYLPFFWIGPEEIAYALKDWQHPLYLLPQGKSSLIEHPETYIPAIAAVYVEEILQVFPKGPYFLGGYCFAGLIALEVARQLQQKGHDIGSLVLMEVPSPNRIFNQKTAHLAQWISRPLRYITRLTSYSNYGFNLLNRVVASQSSEGSKSESKSDPNSVMGDTRPAGRHYLSTLPAVAFPVPVSLLYGRDSYYFLGWSVPVLSQRLTQDLLQEGWKGIFTGSVEIVLLQGFAPLFGQEEAPATALGLKRVVEQKFASYTQTLVQSQANSLSVTRS